MNAESRILYIEDDLTSYNFVKRVLRPTRYTISHAAEGTHGLHTAEREQPDLILLALELPDMNGLEIVKQLRQSVRLCDVPVILVTAAEHQAHTYQGDKAILAGCDAYLQKPFSKSLLLKTINLFFTLENI